MKPEHIKAAFFGGGEDFSKEKMDRLMMPGTICAINWNSEEIARMNNNSLDLYKFAEQRCIGVDWVPLQRASSLSLPIPTVPAVLWKISTIALAHELGYCETGSFYCPEAVLDVRQKH